MKTKASKMTTTQRQALMTIGILGKVSVAELRRSHDIRITTIEALERQGRIRITKSDGSGEYAEKV